MNTKHKMTMGDICRELQLPPSKIRFWLSELEIDLSTDQTQGTHRRFSQKDLHTLKWVKKLSETGWFTMQGIKAILENNLSVNSALYLVL